MSSAQTRISGLLQAHMRMAEAASDCNLRNRSAAQVLRARESLSLISQISRLLNTGLDSETLSLCVRLCEAGVHPQALATVVQEIKKEASALKADSGDHNTSANTL